MKKKVLFICTHNSCRSQIAEALLRHKFGDEYEAFSAGTIATQVDPYSKKVLEEIGIDTSGMYSKSSERFMGIYFFKVVTVCDIAREACPFFPGAENYVHKGFRNPPILVREEGMEPMEAFRKIRDEIGDWIENDFSP